MRSEPPQEENVFGSADGSAYSAVLVRDAEGRYTLQSLLVDGHNLPVHAAGPWAHREDAVRAVEAYARGDRQP